MSRDGGAARLVQMVTEHHSGGHFLSIAFSRNNILLESLWRLIWPCTGHSLLMFNPWDRDSMLEPAHRGSVSVQGWQWVAGHT